MSAPDVIFLQWWGDGDPDDPGEVYIDEVTWQDERIFDHDVEFVRRDKADALAEALELYANSFNYETGSGGIGPEEAEAVLAAYRGKA